MQTIHSTDVELGHLAHPGEGAHPGVVVIPDVWGLSEHYRGIARRLADDGLAALVVDLYRRAPEPKIDDPGAFIRALDDRQVIGDVQAAIDFLGAHPAVGALRVGLTGFCMGGMYALLAGASCRGLSAVVAFYGMLSDEHGLLAPAPGERHDRARKPRTPLAAAGDLACPTLAFFGEDDPFIAVDDVHRFESKLAEEHRVVVYPGAGHAFMNDGRPEMYRPAVAADAWARMTAWFHRHLGKR
ncbi:MAG: hypothetical protein DCC71_21810 [Proteobacteria bacterium]|nr:MAG: hypothetical protein DCC71_21810 [Pseudomonadota bacterium]